MDTITLVVKPADKPGRYEVMIEGSGTLLGATRLPFYESARELLRRGFNPEAGIAFRHDGSATISMRSSIEQAANLTVDDDSSGRPKVRAFRGSQSHHVDLPMPAHEGAESSGCLL